MSMFIIALLTIATIRNQPINRWRKYCFNGVLFFHKEKWNPDIFRKLHRTGAHHVKRNMSDTER
jgi:hypothetical protein